MNFDARESCFNEANHFTNLENSEVLRLRKLMHESILKVEKENLETIQKDLNNQKETNVKIVYSNNPSVKTPKHSNGPLSTALQTRSVLLREMKHPKSSLHKVQTASSTKSSDETSRSVCKNVQTNCQYSSIHFLNHFHSSFLSSKTQKTIQSNDFKDKYTACAVPLAPPSQKKEIVNLKQDFSTCKNSVCVPNNVAYHIVSEDKPKKLTVQALPSISIMGRKPINNENIRFEEIREKNYSAGDCIKTTILPAMSEEVRNRISSINLSSSQINKISGSKETNDPSPKPLKKSVFTQSFLDDGSLQSQLDKSLLKEIIKEAFQEFQYDSAKEFTKLSTDMDFLPHSNAPKMSRENDCELDSFMGNADSQAIDVTTMVSPNTFMKTNCTQTIGYDTDKITYNEMYMRNLVHKVLLEMQQNSSLRISESAEEPNNALIIEKVHKDIQVDLKQNKLNEEIMDYNSKALQTSFVNTNETLCTEKEKKISDINNSFVEDFEVISNSADMQNSEIPKYLEENNEEVPSKLESVLNFVYNRFCRETGELSLSAERILSNNSPPSIRTREVSIQFNPVSTSTKSTATSEVALTDAFNQCDILIPQQVEEKNRKHASIQVIPESEMVMPVQEKVDSSVQWEQPAAVLKDSCVQTMEFLNPPENSANSSVSSTPLSDSIFLDDMLSEGEVFLPWNLRLLTLADKATIQSSNNTTETSDKEKDYSLSEGEEPPKYFQQFNIAQSSSYDSSSDAYTDPQMTPTPTQQNRLMIDPERESLPMTSKDKHCSCQASSSSLSEGEVKDSSTSLSEGEVPYGFLRHRLALHLDGTAQASASVAPQYESRIRHRKLLDSSYLGESSQTQENLGHSILDLSEGEIIEQSQTPYQSTPFTSFLDTVNEEK